MIESHGTIPERDPAAVEAGVAAVKRIADDQLADVDQRLSDIRDAAIWNTIMLAKSHGQGLEVTEDDVAHWRYIRSVTDRIAENGGEGEFVPQGFGPAVRTRQAEALIKLAASANLKSNVE